MKVFLKNNLKYVILFLIVVAFAAAAAFGAGNLNAPSSYYQTGELTDGSYYNALCYEIDIEDGYKLESVWVNFGGIDYTLSGGDAEDYMKIHASVTRSLSMRFFTVYAFKGADGGDSDKIKNSYSAVKAGEWQRMCHNFTNDTYPIFLLSTENTVKINEIAFVGVNGDGELKLLSAKSVGSGAKKIYTGTGSSIEDSQEFNTSPEAKKLADKLIDEQNKFNVKYIGEDGSYTLLSGITEEECITLESVRNLSSGRGYFADLSANPLGQFIIALGVAVFGGNTFGLRIMPLLFTLGSIVLVYFIGLTLFGKPKYGLIFSFIFSIGGFSLYFATIGRVDAIFTFFILAAFYSGIKFLIKGVSNKNMRGGLVNIVLGGVSFGLAFCIKTSAVFYALPVLGLFAAGVVKQYLYAKRKAVNGTAEFKRKFSLTLALGTISYIAVPVILTACTFLAAYSSYGAFLGDKNLLVYASKGTWGYFTARSYASYSAANLSSPLGFIVNYQAAGASENKFVFSNVAVAVLNLFSLLYCAIYTAVLFTQKEKVKNYAFIRAFACLSAFFLFGWLFNLVSACSVEAYYTASVFSSCMTVLVIKLFGENDKKPLIKVFGADITATRAIAGLALIAATVVFALAVPAFIGVSADSALYYFNVLSHTVV